MTFVMAYDKRNRENLEKLATNTKKAAYQWYQFCIDNGIDILIHETIRTKEQQEAYVASGKSQTMKSYHLVGQALDFVPAYIDAGGKPGVDWSSYDKEPWKKAIAKSKALGFEWGGDWKNFVDKPHLQYNYKGYGTDTFSGAGSSVPSSTTSTNKGDSTIRAVQETLNKRYGFNLAVDGIPGPKTDTALTKALQVELNKQYKAGLIVDGKMGPKTKAACPTIQKGAKGNLTYILQAKLYILGFDPKGIDGIFGNGTEAAVKAFQKANKLAVDGKAGKETFAKLFA